MKLLRDHKDALLGVLEPFLRDPTVAWGRSGRAQKADDSGCKAKPRTIFADMENADAKAALEKISGRLEGIYNLAHPKAEAITREYVKRHAPLPARGLGASRDDNLPLSVEGQVQRMITEAIAEENLAQMYCGWTPWL